MGVRPMKRGLCTGRRRCDRRGGSRRTRWDCSTRCGLPPRAALRQLRLKRHDSKSWHALPTGEGKTKYDIRADEDVANLARRRAARGSSGEGLPRAAGMRGRYRRADRAMDAASRFGRAPTARDLPPASEFARARPGPAAMAGALEPRHGHGRRPSHPGAGGHRPSTSRYTSSRTPSSGVPTASNNGTVCPQIRQDRDHLTRRTALSGLFIWSTR